MVKKDLAKVLFGASIVEVINHTVLTMNNILPMHIFGFVISKTTNFVILIGWICVFIVSLYVGWIKK